MSKKAKRVGVLARCVGCGRERIIGPGDIEPGDHPICDVCFMPLVAKAAVGTREVKP